MFHVEHSFDEEYGGHLSTGGCIELSLQSNIPWPTADRSSIFSKHGDEHPLSMFHVEHFDLKLNRGGGI